MLSPSVATRSPLGWLRWLLLRSLQLVFVLALALGGASLIGLVPVNRDFQEAPEGIEIVVYVDSAHSELIVPIRTDVRDWSPWFSASDFRDIRGDETHVAFGWGDREFFLHTRHWEDLRGDLTARAMLWPTDTVMHVSLMHKPKLSGFYRSVTIEPAAYEQMVDFIESYFVVDGAAELGGVQPQVLPGEHYGFRDAFYRGEGTYSALYTCNAWVGDALQAAGIRTGCWTPWPYGILQTND